MGRTVAKRAVRKSTPVAPVEMTENRLPRWFMESLAVPFRAGIASVFLIHGDINGLMPNQDGDEVEAPYINLRSFLEQAFDERPMVIFYNIASGLEFLTPEMENVFKRLVGFNEQAAPSTDPVSAARASLQAKRGLPREPEACLPLIEKVLRKQERTAVIIQSVHFIAADSGPNGALLPTERINIERLKNWAQDETIRKQKSIVLLMTDQAAKVTGEFRRSGAGIPQIIIPKPSESERLSFIRAITEGIDGQQKLLERLKQIRLKIGTSKGTIDPQLIAEQEVVEDNLVASGIFITPDDFRAKAFAHATQGMSLRQILEIFLRAKAEGNAVNLDYAKSKKREILNAEYGDLLELVEPERGLEDIGGLEHIKSFFREVLGYIKTGDHALVPMGITLMGPPGTGKTALVEALAKGAGFNFVKTKNIRSMWVGESEARSERLVTALRSLAPVVVMNDEADLGEAQRDSPKGDSGVSERLMQQWMTFLSDPRIRGQVLVINCTNRPDRMDAALKRSGRSDDRILVPMPGLDERVAIFPVMFKRHNIATSITEFKSFAVATDGLSGADLENIVRNAARFARQAGRATVDQAALTAAIADFIPSASQAEIDYMTLVGLLENSSRKLLPSNVATMVKDIKARGLVPNFEEIMAQLKTRQIA